MVEGLSTGSDSFSIKRFIHRLYTSFVKSKGKRGFPRWKSKNRHRPSIPIEINSDPFKFKADGVYFRIKKGHEVQLIHYHRQLKRFQNPIPKVARITQSTTGKWYCYVDAVQQTEDQIGMGIDRHVRQNRMIEVIFID